MTETTNKDRAVSIANLALSKEQQARVAALHVAREVLAQKGFASSGPVDAVMLTDVADYILLGKKPDGLLIGDDKGDDL